MAKKKKGLTARKARMMLHDDSAQGHALTKAQRGYFGAVSRGKARKRS
jgi:hypothetical protein